jgi:hypothetical protein
MWISVIIVIIVGLVTAAYLVLRAAPGHILGLYDRALRNNRDRVEARYELPVYAQRDLSTKWPGWDGWYILMVPREEEAPVKAIRVSMMTGLYGLDGIDNYAELRGLSPFEAVEYLMMVQTDTTSHLFRRYLPKQADLAIRRDQLLVVVKDWGEIGGQWPHYRVQMRDPEAGIELALDFTGKHLIWWADLPHLFTYYAAFGDLQGTLSLNGQEYRITGMGSFEHGYARKPFNFDAFLRPLRTLQKFFGFTMIHYHYNLLIGTNGLHGGMMLAQGIGVDFRNLGGIYLPDGRFVQLEKIAIDYLESEKLESPSLSPAVLFPKKWMVRAQAGSGTFEYHAIRKSPAALIAHNMIYSDFRFTGTYRAPGADEVKVSGRGYGEFVRM